MKKITAAAAALTATALLLVAGCTDETDADCWDNSAATALAAAPEGRNGGSSGGKTKTGTKTGGKTNVPKPTGAARQPNRAPSTKPTGVKTPKPPRVDFSDCD
jgi:hypothetical protein